MVQTDNKFETLYCKLPESKQVGFARLIHLLAENPELLDSLAHEDADGVLKKLRELIEALSQQPSVST